MRTPIEPAGSRPDPAFEHTSVSATSASFATLDDLLYAVFRTLLREGAAISPTKGPARELTGVQLELTNPRARLSRTETRGKPFSCLGEFCWYLAGSDDVGFIEYYIPGYKHFANGQRVFGAYGPRLLNHDGHNQVCNVIKRLQEKPHSRRAVIQLFQASDLVADAKDIPCTCTLQFLCRNDALHMFVYMRSNDAYIGLPHDVFFFTMLQEVVARDLSLTLGSYKHLVGSLHLYDTDTALAKQFLAEGWQSTLLPMARMPQQSPWPAIKILLQAEATLRAGELFCVENLGGLDQYWSELIRLLIFFRAYKTRNVTLAREIHSLLDSSVYRPFLHQKLLNLREASDGRSH